MAYQSHNVAEQIVEDGRNLLRDRRALSEPSGLELSAAKVMLTIATIDMLWPFLLSDFHIATRKSF